MKARRRYTNDRERMLVDLDRAPEYARVILKMDVPVGVREHDIRRAIRAALIGGVEKPAHLRLQFQYIEIISAHLLDPNARGIVARVQPRYIDVIGGQPVECAVAIA